jgi:hypothetical protein
MLQDFCNDFLGGKKFELTELIRRWENLAAPTNKRPVKTESGFSRISAFEVTRVVHRLTQLEGTAKPDLNSWPWGARASYSGKRLIRDAG